MRVLAIDTALEACSAAVLDTSSGITASETLAMTRGHAEAVMPLIARVMSTAAIEFADLDRIAVTTGPGSFTGLRVGISAARGIALAAGKPAIGLSTLAGLAAPYIAADDSMPVVAAIDAHHDNVYLQVVGPSGRTLVPPRLERRRDRTHADRARRAGAPCHERAQPGRIHPVGPGPGGSGDFVGRSRVPLARAGTGATAARPASAPARRARHARGLSRG